MEDRQGVCKKREGTIGASVDVDWIGWIDKRSETEKFNFIADRSANYLHPGTINNNQQRTAADRNT